MKAEAKLAVLLILLTVISNVVPVNIYAAAKSITAVNIKVGTSDLTSGESLLPPNVYNSGESPDFSSTYVATNSERYYIEDKGSDMWITSIDEPSIGDEPRMKVTLIASNSDEYAFKGSYQSSNVTITGGTFISAKRISDSELVVTLRVKAIKGTYDAPQDAYWKYPDAGNARWTSGVNGSGAYDVYLYRGATVIKKLEKLKATSFDFYPYMTKAGTYTFKVRTVPYTSEDSKYGKKSEWTVSDEYYLPKEQVSDGSGQESGSGGTSNSGSGPGVVDTVGWIFINQRWYYRFPDGSYQKNGWLKINQIWYLFDENGVMLTGWQQNHKIWYYMAENGGMLTGWIKYDNKWYYLNPSMETGIEGALLRGWITYNNKYYYMTESGIMAEGWYQVDGNWYYFYPGEGSKAISTSINGLTLDANGVWQK